MIKNYFKLTWRNIIKDTQSVFLNLVGLSTGLACAILVYLWVSDELKVDRFNENDSRLYQVLKRNSEDDGVVQVGENTQGLLAKAIDKEMPEVEVATCMKKERSNGILSVGNKPIKARPIFAAENFFTVFSYELISGNRNTALSNISDILISEPTAMKLFNSTDVVNNTIKWEFEGNVNYNGLYKIAGVFKAPPSNATIQFDVVFPFELYASKNAGGMGDISFWGSNMVATYVVLKPGTDIHEFGRKIKDFSKQKIKSLYADKEMLKYEGELFLQKYSDRYLYNNFVDGVQSGGRIEYVTLFSLIAIFILLIASINYMNLSTARASRRMKEVGIKKIIGATKSTLVFQYIGESLLLAFASSVVAFLLVLLFLPVFEEITGKIISLHLRSDVILPVVGITLITGLISGIYPALYLSRFKPVAILKGKLNFSSSEPWIRKGLVVFQFCISIILIVSVLVVYRQMKLIQTKNLGYNKDNILRFSNDGNLKNNSTSLITELKKISGVINASSVSGDLMGNYSHSGGGISWEGKNPDLGIQYYGNSIDNNFLQTMNLQITEGRGFSDDFKDSSSVLFNQSAITAMGLKNPVGKTVSLWGKKKQIVGVVKDYHFESLYKKIGAAFFTFSENNPTTIVKIKAGTETQTIAGIKKLYSKYNNGLEFNYSFLDDDYNALYASEQRVALLSKYFAAIAILISCLGLFGLAAFTAQKRRKEIGIRKVVGASVGHVATMLSSDFLKLVCIALLIAVPVSWWLVTEWLQSFAYRINVDAGLFLIAAAIIILITLFTVSFQTIKAAVANPVKSLRTE